MADFEELQKRANRYGLKVLRYKDRYDKRRYFYTLVGKAIEHEGSILANVKTLEDLETAISKFRQYEINNLKSMPANSDALPIQTVFIIPSTQDGDKPITNKQMEKRIEEVRRKTSSLFGGYTELKGAGGYYSSDKNKLIVEDNIQVMGFSSIKSYEANKNKWLKFVREKARQWGQEAIGVIVENDMFYVYA